MRDGFVSPIDLFSTIEIEKINNEIKRLSATKTGKLSSISRINTHLLSHIFWDLVHDNRILDIVEKLIGSNIYCIGSSIIDKLPDSQSFVACHQDATFWGLSKPIGATVWIALTAANKQNGGMYFVKHSHLNQLPHFDTKNEHNMLGARESVIKLPAESEKTYSDLKPGQISIHHPLVLHGSPNNLSSESRLAFVIRYIPSSVKQDNALVTLVRGANLSKMKLLSRPKTNASYQMLIEHGRAMKQNADVIKRAKYIHLKENNGYHNE
uniref:phytanoyl-CoA dioxygenase family protein n=1 Tax=Synechococcus sp. UW106 TaxID=368495 RepID=UPI001483C1B3|nr:phytanoyl-CoA dioxygenase family protein [Synechococcus sp. UW106]